MLKIKDHSQSGPIDIEKYKSDQGTSQKWTEHTTPTKKPRKS